MIAEDESVEFDGSEHVENLTFTPPSETITVPESGIYLAQWRLSSDAGRFGVTVDTVTATSTVAVFGTSTTQSASGSGLLDVSAGGVIRLQNVSELQITTISPSPAISGDTEFAASLTLVRLGP